MKKYFFLIGIHLLLSGNISSKPVQMDVVLCMDLSGSTNGLLDNFRERYWEIINEAEKFHSPVHLRIGFISYSRPSYLKANLYIKVIHDLTDDFDALAKEVFAIKTITDQGDQYVGAAISSALKNMSWSKDKEAIKLIFAVGNGSAFLGGTEYITACNKAVSSGVVINTVFCKTYVNVKEISQWKEVAQRAGGLYYEIDINKKLPVLPSSKAKDMLSEMNEQLNKTYVPYGVSGKSRFQTLQKIDEEMQTLGESPFCERAGAKVSSQFLEKNHSWDLVDLSLNKKIPWAELDTAYLPENLKNKTTAERNSFIDLKWQDRRTYISNMRVVYKNWRRERDEWIVDMKVTEQNTLGRVIIDGMTIAAEKKGIKKKT